ncbi:MAG: LacI family DNA-binding transcriptional regulator [Janthinobacterium lividum]
MGLKPRAATIRDVARSANVSVASVSRALNGLDNVTAATRGRVLQAAAELSYVPNAAARSLSRAETRIIGIVVPDLHGEFFSELIRGFDLAASEAGYLLLLSTMHADPALAGQALRAMHGRVDGLLVMAPQLSAAEIDRLIPADSPCLQIFCEPNPRRPTIGVDNRKGAHDAARHLLSTGRRRLVHIAGPRGNHDADERRDAFVEALHAFGHEAPLLVDGDFREGGGARAIDQLIASNVSFDAVFAANDMMAFGAMTALRSRGVRVPEDVAMVGFDDIPLARHLGLTTLRVRTADIGAVALRRLIAILGGAGEAPILQQLPPELIVRASSDGGDGGGDPMPAERRG